MHMERMCYNTLWIMEVQSRASGHPGPHNCATLNSSVCARGSIYCSDDQPPQNKTCQRYSSNAVSQPHTVNYFRFKISHITMCTNHTRTSHTHVIDIKAISYKWIYRPISGLQCMSDVNIDQTQLQGVQGVRDGSQVELFVKGNPSLLLAFVNAVAVLGQLGFYSMTSNMFQK